MSPVETYLHLSCVQVLQLAQDNPKYKAIDRAIGKESFKVVTLLRLSPLLPLALSNYFYGITRHATPQYCLCHCSLWFYI